jgi:hypothetical protein
MLSKKENKYYHTSIPISPDLLATIDHLNLCEKTKKHYIMKTDIDYN